MIIDEEYGVIIKAEVGDEVWDDLTNSNTKIVKISFDDNGNIGYWLDNEYLSGGRFPWEISPKIKEKENGI